MRILDKLYYISRKYDFEFTSFNTDAIEIGELINDMPFASALVVWSRRHNIIMPMDILICPVCENMYVDWHNRHMKFCSDSCKKHDENQRNYQKRKDYK
jgi:hypothetical protein